MRKIAAIFTKKLGKELNQSHVYRTTKNRKAIESMADHPCVSQLKNVKNPKEILLMEELSKEISIRNSLTANQINTEKDIRVLAIELAAQEKYDNYFATHKFSGRWMLKFRRLFNIPYIRPGKTLTGIKR